MTVTISKEEYESLKKLSSLGPNEISIINTLNDPEIKKMNLTEKEIEFAKLNFDELSNELTKEKRKVSRLEDIYWSRRKKYYELTGNKCTCNRYTGCSYCYTDD